MPEITNGWARMDLADAADRKLLIESGVIWRCGKRAVQMAVEDLVAGMVPMNDKVPPEIAAIIGKIQASRTGMTPLDPTIAPLAKAWDNTVPMGGADTPSQLAPVGRRGEEVVTPVPGQGPVK